MQEQQVLIFRALADPTRLDIVRTLRQKHGSASCGEVSSCSRLSQPAMSHHFSKLVEAGVVRQRKNGKQKFYELNSSLLKSVGLDIHKL